jgi:hypothetical protein
MMLSLGGNVKATYQTVPFHKVITIFFLAAIVLFSTFHPVGFSAARAQQGAADSLSGWFMILRGDSQDGSVAEIHQLAGYRRWSIHTAAVG